MKGGGRNPSLDGLRGIAILAVVGFHVRSFPRNGQLGVDLFFVLSGFLITTFLIEGRYPTLRSFYEARCRRILPALFVLLVIYAIVGAIQERASTLLSVLAGATFTTDMATAWTRLPLSFGLGTLWSLGIEEQFYVLWPLILLLVVRKRLALAAAALAVTAVLVTLRDTYGGLPSAHLEFGPDTRCVGLIAGSLAAILLQTEKRDVLMRASRPLLPAVSIVLFLLVIALPGGWTFRWGVPLFAMLSLVLLARALAEQSRVAAFLSFAPLVYVGRISYSLYLWHWPIHIWLGTTRPLLAVIISFVVAVLSYHLVEQPFLRRGRVQRARSVEPVAGAT